MRRHIIMILALLLTPMLSVAHLKTARNLKAVCDAMHKSSQNAGQCNSYIHGVYDAIDGVMACPPAAATHQDKVRVVREFMKAHPERLDEHEANLVVEALKQAYPCGAAP